MSRASRPDPSAPNDASVGGWLEDLDRRLRGTLGLQRSAALLPGAAVALLIARWFDFLLLDSVWLSAVVLLAAVATFWVLRLVRIPPEPGRAAATVDRKAALDDLVKTASRLESTSRETASTVPTKDAALRGGIERLVVGRARAALAELRQRDIQPWRIPRKAIGGILILLLAALLPLPATPTASADSGARLIASADEASENDSASDESASSSRPIDEEIVSDLFEPREVRQIAELDPRLAALLQSKGTELDAEALADLASSADGSELSQDTLARLEELVERFGEELAEADRLAEANERAAPGEFEELSRESGGAPSPPSREEGSDGPEQPQANGEKAAAGDAATQSAAQGPPSESSGEAGDQVQTIEMPPTGDSKLRQAEAGQADLQLRGDGLQVAGEQSGTQEGEQRPGAGGGDSSGPQSGESELYGEELPESQVVTLELTLLKAREEADEREQRPERRWRSSRQETSKVRAERLPRGDWSAPDQSPDRDLLPRHHRENLRKYFTPEPTTTTPPTAQQQKQNLGGARP